MRAICLNWHGDVQGDASLAYSRKCKHLLGHNNEQFEVKIIVIQFEVEQQFGEYQFSNSGILPSNAGVMLNKHPVWSVSTKSYAMLAVSLCCPGHQFTNSVYTGLTGYSNSTICQKNLE